MKQTISVLVENQAGVLNRITGLFSRRAFNIESLAVGVTDDPTISRITIIVDSGNSVVEQVEKQLNKLVEVIKVRTLDENTFIGRELMILKVNANNKTRQDIMTIQNKPKTVEDKTICEISQYFSFHFRYLFSVGYILPVFSFFTVHDIVQ